MVGEQCSAYKGAVALFGDDGCAERKDCWVVYGGLSL